MELLEEFHRFFQDWNLGQASERRDGRTMTTDMVMVRQAGRQAGRQASEGIDIILSIDHHARPSAAREIAGWFDG